jgi:hypothetical protein
MTLNNTGKYWDRQGVSVENYTFTIMIEYEITLMLNE